MADRHGEGAPAVETLRRERAERLPHDARAVRRLPPRAGLPTAGTAPQPRLNRGRTGVFLGAVHAHDPALDTPPGQSKGSPKTRKDRKTQAESSGGGEIRTAATCPRLAAWVRDPLRGLAGGGDVGGGRFFHALVREAARALRR